MSIVDACWNITALVPKTLTAKLYCNLLELKTPHLSRETLLK